MSTILRAIEFLGLSIWLGSDVFLSFVVAPGAFSVLASRDEAGAIVGYSLTRMHWIGLVCGVAILLVRALVTPAALCVLLMIILTVISQVAVSPKMAELRVRMGSIESATTKRSTDATAEGNPLLAEFEQLHTISVGLESGVLLAGMVALILMVQRAQVR